MFAYGFLSVVLALYLSELGFSDTVIGVLLSLTLIGDAVGGLDDCEKLLLAHCV